MICAAFFVQVHKRGEQCCQENGEKLVAVFFFFVSWCFVNFTRQGREGEEKSEKAVKRSIVFFEEV